MSKREAGQFRSNIFGGFNRKDVLAYITSVYEELEHVQMENDMLREHCGELEALLHEQGIEFAPPMPMPDFEPEDFAPEEPMPEPVAPFAAAQFEPEQFEPEENMMERPEDIPRETPPAPEPVPIPLPTPPVYETPRIKPALANPYPERSRKVKVRPVRES